MDRAGNVDSVDGSEVSLEETTGWDAYSVWRDRVHDARATTAARGPRAARAPRDAAGESASSGWDPLATWHGRVRAARSGR